MVATIPATEPDRLSRRRFLRLGLGLAVAVGLGRSAAPAREEKTDGTVGILDVCYWETRRTTILNGRRWEYRCEVCCAGGACETVRCTWVDVGPA